MNIEQLREYCLSLGEVEEKFPFFKFKAARDVLAFYVRGHIFCYFDINDMRHINVKSQPNIIEELKEQHNYIDKPYNGNPKYWISIDAIKADNHIIQELVNNSYRIVREKYAGHQATR